MYTLSPNTLIESAKLNSNFTDLSTGDADTTNNSLVTSRDEGETDYVISGGVWSGDSYAVNRNASMTALVARIDGYRVTVALVSARTFTASKDTYVDVLRAGTSASLVYTEVANNAASPALASNSLRLGIVVTGASTIAAATSINQGKSTVLLPSLATGILRGADSLGNILAPKGPASNLLMTNPYKFSVYRAAALTSTTSYAAVQFDTKLYDTGANVDVVTNKGRFTAPVDGFYSFSASAGNTVASAGIHVKLYKNGVAAKAGVYNGGAASTGFISHVSGDLQLVAGDYVEAYFVGGSGSAMNVGADNCYFDGRLTSRS